MRHEKGMSQDLPRLAADRAAHLLAAITGASVGRGIVDNDPEPGPPVRIEVSVAATTRLLGIDLDQERITELLRPLGFALAPADADTMVVTVPPHRLDVTLAADVAEEIARAHGYDRIPGRLPSAVLPAYRMDPSGPRHLIRRVLAGLGLDEMVGHALIGPDDLVRIGSDPGDPALIRLHNPLSIEHSLLRPSMVPSLLRGLADNARQRQPNAWLFDLGKVYWYNPGPATPRDRASQTAGTGRYESWELGIALAGAAVPASPGEPTRHADLADLKGIIDALHDAMGAPRPAYRAETPKERHAHRHPGRTGLVVDSAGRPYGSFGEVHPRVAEAWGIGGRPVDASIAVNRLLDLVPTEGRSVPIPAAQPIDRDLAVVLDDATPAGDLLRVTRMSAGPMLVDLSLFDIYRGEQIGPGRVSYALALRFQPAEAGDEASIEKALNKVRGSLRHHLGAEIR